VKVLIEHAEDVDHATERFHREAQILQRLQHPNILRVYEYGHQENVGFYFVMEFLEGCDLKTFIKEMKGQNVLPTFTEVANMFSQICSAVSYAHQFSVVHRDIKPSNIFLVGGDPQGTIKLLDFGIVKILNADSSFVTSSGLLVGTPSYFSPEQAQALAADYRADIYSLCVVLFECLTGHLPFVGTNAFHFIMHHLHGKVPKLAEKVKDRFYPEILDAIIAKGMAKKPEDRYQSVIELQNEILYALEEDTGDFAVMEQHTIPDMS